MSSGADSERGEDRPLAPVARDLEDQRLFAAELLEWTAMTCLAKLRPALSIAATFVLACSANEPPAPTKVATPEIAAGPSEADPAEPDGVPKIASDGAVFEFGAIKATDSVKHVFTLRNIGTADLKIERVHKT